MFWPESAIIEGRVVQIEPTIRTIYLRVYDEGAVKHQQEFIDNVAGQKQYAANMGGFSTTLRYATNAGDGMILDGQD